MFRYCALGIREVCFFLNRFAVCFDCNSVAFPRRESFPGIGRWSRQVGDMSAGPRKAYRKSWPGGSGWLEAPLAAAKKLHPQS